MENLYGTFTVLGLGAFLLGRWSKERWSKGIIIRVDHHHTITIKDERKTGQLVIKYEPIQPIKIPANDDGLAPQIRKRPVPLPPAAQVNAARRIMSYIRKIAKK